MIIFKVTVSLKNICKCFILNFNSVCFLETLDRFTEIIRQLLQDMEERLVFRTHIFFQNDLMSYQPSPGDLAYPEKLEQMEVKQILFKRELI